jgi:hypothetical protein
MPVSTWAYRQGHGQIGVAIVRLAVVARFDAADRTAAVTFVCMDNRANSLSTRRKMEPRRPLDAVERHGTEDLLIEARSGRRPIGRLYRRRTGSGLRHCGSPTQRCHSDLGMTILSSSWPGLSIPAMASRDLGRLALREANSGMGFPWHLTTRAMRRCHCRGGVQILHVRYSHQKYAP